MAMTEDEKEAAYDADVAPLLFKAAERATELGMPMICDVEYVVGKLGTTDQARRYLGYSEGQTLEEAGLADNRRDRIRGITALLNKAREDLSGYLSILRGPSVVENAVTLNVTKLMLDETRVILAEIEVALAKPKKIP